MNYIQPDSQPHAPAASGALPTGASIGVLVVPGNFLQIGPNPSTKFPEPITAKDVPHGYETPSRH